MMDALSSILENVKLSCAVYFKSNFSAPWGMKMDAGNFAQFHLVVRGHCWLRLKGSERSIELSAGDIIVFPHGDSHSLSDKLGSKKTSGKKVLESILKDEPIFSGDKITTTLVCGHFDFDRNLNHPFIKSLPEIIHLTDNERRMLPWLENITNLIIQEIADDKAGGSAVVNKLGEILFIHTLRAYFLNNRSEIGFWAALQDERLSTSLKLIHNNPEKEWTLDRLSKESGMSRTNFINKFRSLVGQTPLEYITNWRIIKAKQFLEETQKSVGEIAESVGYRSEAAFNRVFKKRALQTPLKYRHSFLNKGNRPLI